MRYTIKSLLNQNRAIYSIPDDRLYTVEDLLHNLQKFLFDYSKSSNRKDKLLNLNVGMAWYFALINRYHIDLELIVWRRYSYKCPFCLDIPCDCDSKKKTSRQRSGRPSSRKPQNIRQWQDVILRIYPSKELKKVNNQLFNILNDTNYAFRLFMREKRNKQFQDIENKTADFFVILINIYNVLGSDLNDNFLKLFNHGCYICHQTPCQCNYFE